MTRALLLVPLVMLAACDRGDRAAPAETKDASTPDLPKAKLPVTPPAQSAAGEASAAASARGGPPGR